MKTRDEELLSTQKTEFLHVFKKADERAVSVNWYQKVLKTRALTNKLCVQIQKKVYLQKFEKTLKYVT